MINKEFLIITDSGEPCDCFLITTENRRGGTENRRVIIFSVVLRGFSVALCGFYGHVRVQV